MAFSYTGGAQNSGNSASASVTHGQTINSGDLVVFYVTSNSTTLPSVDSDSGAAWTSGFSVAPSGETSSHALAWKVAGTEPASFSFTVGSAEWRCIVKVFTSATDAVVDVAAATDDTSADTATHLNCEAQSGASISANAVSIIVGCKENRQSASGDVEAYTTADQSYVSVIGDSGTQACAMAHRIDGGTGFTGPTVVNINTADSDDNMSDTTSSGHISFVESSAGTTIEIPVGPWR